jgi:hypothetical protein
MAAAVTLALGGYGPSETIGRLRTGDLPPGRAADEQSTHRPAAAAPSPIKHIVFILEENRSFDNVFGRFPGADGATTAKLSVGGRDMTTPLVPEPY